MYTRALCGEFEETLLNYTKVYLLRTALAAHTSDKSDRSDLDMFAPEALFQIMLLMIFYRTCAQLNWGCVVW